MPESIQERWRKDVGFGTPPPEGTRVLGFVGEVYVDTDFEKKHPRGPGGEFIRKGVKFRNVDWRTEPVERESIENLPAARRLRGILGDQLEIRGDGDYQRMHVTDLAKLPDARLRQLRDHEVKIVIGEEAIPGLGDRASWAAMRPRGWPPGKTYSDVAAGFLKSENKVMVGNSAPLGGSASAALHESGHAVDWNADGGHPRSSDPEFIDLYNDLLNESRLTPYFSQIGDAGHEELYAEAIANVIVDPADAKARWGDKFTNWIDKDLHR